MKTIFSLLTALGVITFTHLDGTILEMTHFADLKDFASEGTLIVIDLDDTLYIPAQTLGSFDWFHYRLKQNLELDLAYNAALLKTQNEMEAVRKISDYTVLQPQTQEILSTLQDENVGVIGITSFRYTFAPVLLNQLDDLELNFSTTLYSFYQPSSNNFDESILMTNGVLFAGWKQKVNALKALFSTIEEPPTHLVYVSKNSRELIPAEKLAHHLKMSFVGLHYIPFGHNFPIFRPEVADLQWVLSTLEQIVSDEAAEAYLSWLSPK